MITKEQGDKIKEILGSSFMDKIKEALKEENVLSQKKKELSTAMISLILSGKRLHEKAEKVIWNLTDRKVREIEKEKERQLSIFDRFDSIHHKKKPAQQ